MKRNLKTVILTAMMSALIGMVAPFASNCSGAPTVTIDTDKLIEFKLQGFNGEG